MKWNINTPEPISFILLLILSFVTSSGYGGGYWGDSKNGKAKSGKAKSAKSKGSKGVSFAGARAKSPITQFP